MPERRDCSYSNRRPIAGCARPIVVYAPTTSGGHRTHPEPRKPVPVVKREERAAFMPGSSATYARVRIHGDRDNADLCPPSQKARKDKEALRCVRSPQSKRTAGLPHRGRHKNRQRGVFFFFFGFACNLTLPHSLKINRVLRSRTFPCLPLFPPLSGGDVSCDTSRLCTV